MNRRNFFEALPLAGLLPLAAQAKQDVPKMPTVIVNTLTFPDEDRANAFVESLIEDETWQIMWIGGKATFPSGGGKRSVKLLNVPRYKEVLAWCEKYGPK